MRYLSTSRREFIAWSVGLGVGLWLRDGMTQSLDVPIRLQAELLSKVVAYDRNFSERARGRPTVLILIRGGHLESERVGEQIQTEIAVLKELGGLPHVEETVRYGSARALAELCVSRSAAVVYVSLGLMDDMPAMADALDGVSTLSVAVAGAYVPKGAVLGFDAEAGRPKLIVNLEQARKQRVAFRPEVLKLARVIA